MRYWLWDFYAVDDFIDVHFRPDLDRLEADQILAKRFYSGHFGYQSRSRMPAGVKTLTVLRDPTEHLASLVAYVRENAPDLLKKDFSRSAFAAVARHFRLSFLKGPLDEQANFQTRMLSNLDDDAAMAASAGEMLQSVRQSLDAMTAFGLTERMRETMLLFSFCLAWPPLAPGDPLNASGRVGSAGSEASQAEISELSKFNLLDGAIVSHARERFDRRLREMVSELGLPASCDPGDPQYASAIEAALRLRFLRSTPPEGLVSSAVWRMEDALFFEGLEKRFYWAPVERWIRWARPAGEVVFYLPLARGCARMTVHVELLLAANEEIRESLRLSVNGQALETGACPMQDGGGTAFIILSAEIPPEALAPDQNWHALRIESAAPEGVKPFALSRVAVSSRDDSSS